MFPFRKKPPSKAEQLKQTLSDGVHTLLEYVPHDKIDAAVSAAQHGGEIAAQKFASVASHVREAASHAGEQAAETATTARQKASQAKENAAEAASHARDQVRETAAHAAEAARERASAAREKLSRKSHKIADQAKDKRDEVLDQIDDAKVGPVRVEVADGSSKWLWWGAGLLVGGAVALLFAPASGRRSRAAIKDRLGKVSKGAADASTLASDKSADLRNRAEGMIHKLDEKLTSDTTAENDLTLVNRVRSELGHLEALQGVERLNINAENGVITLRGPLLSDEKQKALEAAVRAVMGVQDVKSEILTDEKPIDPADSVG